MGRASNNCVLQSDTSTKSTLVVTEYHQSSSGCPTEGRKNCLVLPVGSRIRDIRWWRLLKKIKRTIQAIWIESKPWRGQSGRLIRRKLCSDLTQQVQELQSMEARFHTQEIVENPNPHKNWKDNPPQELGCGRAHVGNIGDQGHHQGYPRPAGHGGEGALDPQRKLKQRQGKNPERRDNAAELWVSRTQNQALETWSKHKDLIVTDVDSPEMEETISLRY